MAKKVHTVTLKGDYTHFDKKIEEETKTGIEIYDLDNILATFDGHQIKITITEEDSLPQMEEV